ncbi:MAG: PepSY domain-containing protein [Chitinophagaceae bacterium]|nr:MAG: PepSY domain-containing protein [Chitinophagaceae bacterium]
MAAAKKKSFGFKKMVGWLHLVLGLSSGLVIVLLGITGCILAFEQEIRSVTQPAFYTAEKNQPVLPPTILRANAEKVLDGHVANGIEYPGAGKSAIVSYYDADHYYMVALDPYTGEVKQKKNMNRDFFRVVLDGHFYLWLPAPIGQPIIASATLIFLVMLITGIILWWPKNKAAAKQRFSIKWSARWRRKNYDLHNVLGFYMSWIGIILAITGLVWGFQWFADSFYWVTNGASGPGEQVFASSDTMHVSDARQGVMDSVWSLTKKQVKADESISVYFPSGNTGTVEVSVNHRPGTYYNTEGNSFDQYTGKRLVTKGTYAGKFSDAKLADQIKRMNYDIHVGAVLGIPGKILMFCASLIAASLPVTGFYIWWGRRKKKPVPKILERAAA